MNKLFHYFYDKKAFYILSLSFIVIFYVILYLYDALIDAIIYATILCLVLLFVYFCIDFILYVRRLHNLKANQQLKDYYTLDLPSSSSLIEKEYQLLLYQINDLLKETKELEENNHQEMLEYFTMWVHQIKTPIFALRLLIDSKNASPHDMLLQVLKIEQYVDMALHYMKLGQISSDLHIQYYSLHDILQDVLKKQATFFIHKKLTLQLDDIDLKVLTDEKWLSFVLEQILSNALKYTKTGGIHIYVKDEVLYIEDTGIGIKAEDLPRIFEKGFTGYNGRVDKKASGLGLYLCARILKYLGHPISMESSQGKGTTVKIDFHVQDLQVE